MRLNEEFSLIELSANGISIALVFFRTPTRAMFINESMGHEQSGIKQAGFG